MDITGKCRIFGNKTETWKKVNGKNTKVSTMRYSTSIAKKNDDGSYNNVYLNVYFKKGTKFEPNEKGSEIDIIAGHLMADIYTNKDGEEVKKVSLYIEDFNA